MQIRCVLGRHATTGLRLAVGMARKYMYYIQHILKLITKQSEWIAHSLKFLPYKFSGPLINTHLHVLTRIV